MLLALFLVFFGSLLLWLVVWWHRVATYWARHAVPYKAPCPLLGNLPELKKLNTSLWMRKLYFDFKNAPYVGIWWFWRPALVVNCPELARRVLVKDADVFRDRFLSSGKSDPIGGLNIFTVNDPTWTFVRRRLTPIFTTAKLKAMESLFCAKSKELCLRFKKEVAQHNFVDIRSVYTDYTTDLIGTAAFGVECNATLTNTDNDPMRVITRDMQKVSLYRGFNYAAIFFFPQLVDIFRFSFYSKAVTDYFRKIWKLMVNQRGGYGRPISETKDLLDALLKMKQEAAEDSEYMSEDLLIAQAAIFVQGGFETSSSILSFTTFELAHHPDVQEKLYKELMELKQKTNNKDFDISMLAEATYLNCVFKESLRKYATMGYLDRVASKDYQLDDKLTIPAGTPVYVNISGIHMDPDYFPEPELFIPERFLPENQKNIKAFTYAPFGEGPRSCIGNRFAMLSMRFAIASLIWEFQLRPAPGSKRPNECKVETNSPFLLPGEMFPIQFVPRKS